MRFFELTESYANIDKTIRNLVLLQTAYYHIMKNPNDVSSANLWAKTSAATMQYLDSTILKMYPGAVKQSALDAEMDDAEFHAVWDLTQQRLRKEYISSYRD